MRTVRDPGDPAKRSPVLAWIWPRREAGYGGKIYDRRIWPRHCGRPATHRTTAGIPQQMDLDGRARRASRIPSEPALEYSLRLALRAADSGNSCGRPRRDPRSRRVALAPVTRCQPGRCSGLACRFVRPAVLETLAPVSRPGLGLPRELHRDLSAARKELLPGTGLSDVVRRGSGRAGLLA